MFGYRVQISFLPMDHDASGSTLPEDPDAFDVSPRGTSVGGTQSDTDGDIPLAEIRISRNEAEVLFRYWFERLRLEDEFNFVYQQIGEWEERVLCSIRLKELEGQVSKGFLDEIAEEVKTRNAQACIDRDEYLNSEDPYAKSLTEDESVGG